MDQFLDEELQREQPAAWRLALGLYDLPGTASIFMGEGRMCFKVAPLAAAAAASTRDSLLWLAACFRFLQTSNLLIHGDLAGVNALVYASFVLASAPDEPGGGGADRDMRCVCLWHAVELLRELINAFAKSEDANERVAAVARLRQLYDVERELDAAIAANPHWKPPAYAQVRAPA